MFKHLLIFFMFMGINLSAQDIISSAPADFDIFNPDVAHGILDTISYTSSTVGTERNAVIYTTPDFSENKKYPVLYLLHGIGGDAFEWLNNGNPQHILDNLYAAGKISPMIVVMPNGRAMEDDRATGNIMAPDKVEAFSTFEDDLLKDLIPYIEKNFPVLAERDQRALAGLSMGGGQSLNFGLGNMDIFGWVGAFSAAPNTKAPEVLLPSAAEAKRLKLLWISCGDQDNLLSFSKRTHDYLAKYEIPHIYYIEPGAHDFKVWKNDLFLFSQLLFKPLEPSIFSTFKTAENKEKFSSEMSLKDAFLG
ncbi:MAG: alpha/beta hydrolase-fold protein, partial [Leeuwenhoekiella sp.]